MQLPPPVIADVVTLTVSRLAWCLLHDRTGDSIPSRYLDIAEFEEIVRESGGRGRLDAVKFWLEEHGYVRPAAGTYWAEKDGHLTPHTLAGSPFIEIVPKVLDYRSGITTRDAVRMAAERGLSIKESAEFVQMMTGEERSELTVKKYRSPSGRNPKKTKGKK